MRQVFAAIALNSTLDRTNRPEKHGPGSGRRPNVPSHRGRDQRVDY